MEPSTANDATVLAVGFSLGYAALILGVWLTTEFEQWQKRRSKDKGKDDSTTDNP